MASQGFLFSESSIAETGVWCSLSEGIDPAQWAKLCRYIGTISPEEFEQLKNKIIPNPDNLKRNFSYYTEPFVDIPLVSIGPSGINGEYQIATIIE
ncbi:hypothetical protein ACFLZ8_01845 [Planctomycetota bacterium]